MTEALRVVVAGLGYFSRFHLEAWQTLDGALLVGVADPDAARRAAAAERFGVTGDADALALIDRLAPDLVDIVAPPPAHAALIRGALAPGRWIVCQKPFCTSIAEAETITAEAEAAGSTLVIHENFRFQPWYRAAGAFLQAGRMGQVYQARFALRPGDGRGPRAYLDRQPAFQTMPRLLIHETGVHFIDLFRWLLGPVDSVYADLSTLNPVLAGEDAGILILQHASGARSIFDGNRLSDVPAEDPRRTMGLFEIEGEAGTMALDANGALSFRPFADAVAKPLALPYPVDPGSFGGGCVAALIRHVIAARKAGRRPENTARAYLPNLAVVEAAYRSAAEGRRLSLTERD